MFNRKGILLSVIAKFMLLYFVLAVVPLDFYHHHDLSLSPKPKSATFRINHHTEHTASLSSYCLICNLHINQKYDVPIFSFRFILFAKLTYQSFGLIHFSHQQSIQDITSRGPPLLT